MFKFRKNLVSHSQAPKTVSTETACSSVESEEMAYNLVETVMGSLSSKVEELKVNLTDQNGPKGGDDLKCTIWIRASGGLGTFVATTKGASLAVVRRAAEKIRSQLQRKIERKDSRRFRSLNKKGSYA